MRFPRSLYPALVALATGSLPMTTHAASSTVPPIAERIPHPVTLHGETRADDYFWLREKTACMGASR